LKAGTEELGGGGEKIENAVTSDVFEGKRDLRAGGPPEKVVMGKNGRGNKKHRGHT